MVFLVTKAALAATIVGIGVTFGALSYLARRSQENGTGLQSTVLNHDTSSSRGFPAFSIFSPSTREPPPPISVQGNGARFSLPTGGFRLLGASVPFLRDCNCKVIHECSTFSGGASHSFRLRRTCGFQGFIRKVCCDEPPQFFSTPPPPVALDEVKSAHAHLNTLGCKHNHSPTGNINGCNCDHYQHFDGGNKNDVSQSEGSDVEVKDGSSQSTTTTQPLQVQGERDTPTSSTTKRPRLNFPELNEYFKDDGPITDGASTGSPLEAALFPDGEDDDHFSSKSINGRIDAAFGENEPSPTEKSTLIEKFGSSINFPSLNEYFPDNDGSELSSNLATTTSTTTEKFSDNGSNNPEGTPNISAVAFSSTDASTAAAAIASEGSLENFDTETSSVNETNAITSTPGSPTTEHSTFNADEKMEMTPISPIHQSDNVFPHKTAIETTTTTTKNTSSEPTVEAFPDVTETIIHGEHEATQKPQNLEFEHTLVNDMLNAERSASVVSTAEEEAMSVVESTTASSVESPPFGSRHANALPSATNEHENDFNDKVITITDMPFVEQVEENVGRSVTRNEESIPSEEIASRAEESSSTPYSLSISTKNDESFKVMSYESAQSTTVSPFRTTMAPTFENDDGSGEMTKTITPNIDESPLVNVTVTDLPIMKNDKAPTTTEPSAKVAKQDIPDIMQTVEEKIKDESARNEELPMSTMVSIVSMVETTDKSEMMLGDYHDEEVAHAQTTSQRTQGSAENMPATTQMADYSDIIAEDLQINSKIPSESLKAGTVATTQEPETTTILSDTQDEQTVIPNISSRIKDKVMREEQTTTVASAMLSDNEQRKQDTTLESVEPVNSEKYNNDESTSNTSVEPSVSTTMRSLLDDLFSSVSAMTTTILSSGENVGNMEATTVASNEEEKGTVSAPDDTLSLSSQSTTATTALSEENQHEPVDITSTMSKITETRDSLPTPSPGSETETTTASLSETGVDNLNISAEYYSPNELPVGRKVASFMGQRDNDSLITLPEHEHTTFEKKGGFVELEEIATTTIVPNSVVSGFSEVEMNDTVTNRYSIFDTADLAKSNDDILTTTSESSVEPEGDVLEREDFMASTSSPSTQTDVTAGTLKIIELPATPSVSKTRTLTSTSINVDNIEIGETTPSVSSLFNENERKLPEPDPNITDSNTTPPNIFVASPIEKMLESSTESASEGDFGTTIKPTEHEFVESTKSTIAKLPPSTISLADQTTESVSDIRITLASMDDELVDQERPSVLESVTDKMPPHTTERISDNSTTPTLMSNEDESATSKFSPSPEQTEKLTDESTEIPTHEPSIHQTLMNKDTGESSTFIYMNNMDVSTEKMPEYSTDQILNDEPSFTKPPEVDENIVESTTAKLLIASTDSSTKKMAEHATESVSSNLSTDVLESTTEHISSTVATSTESTESAPAIEEVHKEFTEYMDAIGISRSTLASSLEKETTATTVSTAVKFKTEETTVRSEEKTLDNMAGLLNDENIESSTINSVSTTTMPFGDLAPDENQGTTVMANYQVLTEDILTAKTSSTVADSKNDSSGDSLFNEYATSTIRQLDTEMSTVTTEGSLTTTSKVKGLGEGEASIVPLEMSSPKIPKTTSIPDSEVDELAVTTTLVDSQELSTTIETMTVASLVSEKDDENETGMLQGRVAGKGPIRFAMEQDNKPESVTPIIPFKKTTPSVTEQSMNVNEIVEMGETFSDHTETVEIGSTTLDPGMVGTSHDFTTLKGEDAGLSVTNEFTTWPPAAVLNDEASLATTTHSVTTSSDLDHDAGHEAIQKMTTKTTKGVSDDHPTTIASKNEENASATTEVAMKGQLETTFTKLDLQSTTEGALGKSRSNLPTTDDDTMETTTTNHMVIPIDMMTTTTGQSINDIMPSDEASTNSILTGNFSDSSDSSLDLTTEKLSEYSTEPIAIDVGDRMTLAKQSSTIDPFVTSKDLPTEKDPKDSTERASIDDSSHIMSSLINEDVVESTTIELPTSTDATTEQLAVKTSGRPSTSRTEAFLDDEIVESTTANQSKISTDPTERLASDAESSMTTMIPGEGAMESTTGMLQGRIAGRGPIRFAMEQDNKPESVTPIIPFKKTTPSITEQSMNVNETVEMGETLSDRKETVEISSTTLNPGMIGTSHDFTTLKGEDAGLSVTEEPEDTTTEPTAVNTGGSSTSRTAAFLDEIIESTTANPPSISTDSTEHLASDTESNMTTLTPSERFVENTTVISPHDLEMRMEKTSEQTTEKASVATTLASVEESNLESTTSFVMEPVETTTERAESSSTDTGVLDNSLTLRNEEINETASTKPPMTTVTPFSDKDVVTVADQDLTTQTPSTTPKSYVMSTEPIFTDSELMETGSTLPPLSEVTTSSINYIDFMSASSTQVSTNGTSAATTAKKDISTTSAVSTTASSIENLTEDVTLPAMRGSLDYAGDSTTEIVNMSGEDVADYDIINPAEVPIPTFGQIETSTFPPPDSHDLTQSNDLATTTGSSVSKEDASMSEESKTTNRNDLLMDRTTKISSNDEMPVITEASTTEMAKAKEMQATESNIIMHDTIRDEPSTTITNEAGRETTSFPEFTDDIVATSTLPSNGDTSKDDTSNSSRSVFPTTGSTITASTLANSDSTTLIPVDSSMEQTTQAVDKESLGINDDGSTATPKPYGGQDDVLLTFTTESSLNDNVVTELSTRKSETGEKPAQNLLRDYDGESNTEESTSTMKEQEADLGKDQGRFKEKVMVSTLSPLIDEHSATTTTENVSVDGNLDSTTIRADEVTTTPEESHASYAATTEYPELNGITMTSVPKKDSLVSEDDAVEVNTPPTTTGVPMIDDDVMIMGEDGYPVTEITKSVRREPDTDKTVVELSHMLSRKKNKVTKTVTAVRSGSEATVSELTTESPTAATSTTTTTGFSADFIEQTTTQVPKSAGAQDSSTTEFMDTLELSTTMEPATDKSLLLDEQAGAEQLQGRFAGRVPLPIARDIVQVHKLDSSTAKTSPDTDAGVATTQPGFEMDDNSSRELNLTTIASPILEEIKLTDQTTVSGVKEVVEFTTKREDTESDDYSGVGTETTTVPDSSNTPVTSSQEDNAVVFMDEASDVTGFQNETESSTLNVQETATNEEVNIDSFEIMDISTISPTTIRGLSETDRDTTEPTTVTTTINDNFVSDPTENLQESRSTGLLAKNTTSNLILPNSTSEISTRLPEIFPEGTTENNSDNAIINMGTTSLPVTMDADSVNFNDASTAFRNMKNRNETIYNDETVSPPTTSSTLPDSVVTENVSEELATYDIMLKSRTETSTFKQPSEMPSYETTQPTIIARLSGKALNLDFTTAVSATISSIAQNEEDVRVSTEATTVRTATIEEETTSFRTNDETYEIIPDTPTEPVAPNTEQIILEGSAGVKETFIEQNLFMTTEVPDAEATTERSLEAPTTVSTTFLQEIYDTLFGASSEKSPHKVPHVSTTTSRILLVAENTGFKTTTTPEPLFTVEVKVGPHDSRSLFSSIQTDEEKQLEGEISNVVSQLLLTTHKNFHLLPNFIECAGARGRTGRRKTRVLQFDTDNYPWMARVGFKEPGGLLFPCAGTIISRRYILTSAHCALRKSNGTAEVMEILLEGAKLVATGMSDQSMFKYKVDEVVVHPNYNTVTRENDLALIRLTREIPSFNGSSDVKPICLPFEDGYGVWDSLPTAGETAYLGGWGYGLKNMAATVEEMEDAAVTIWSNENCTHSYRGDRAKKITPKHICAFGKAEKNACRGDSGGPLMALMTRQRIFFQIGIVSYGPRCGYGVPGVYTRVSDYLSWILDTMRP